MPSGEVRTYVDAGRAWVADLDGAIVGGGVVGFVDGNPHVFQLSVRPTYGRQGYGGSLVECMAAWACAGGHELLTLSTFRDVPFNAPFYERHGFRVLDRSEWGPELRAIAEGEAVRHANPRCCMGRRLG